MGRRDQFRRPKLGPVREFFITNGCYWIEEFHFDGFRFDATHAIHDHLKNTLLLQSAVLRAALPLRAPSFWLLRTICRKPG